VFEGERVKDGEVSFDLGFKEIRLGYVKSTL